MTVPRFPDTPVAPAPLPGVRVPTDVPAAAFGNPNAGPDLRGLQQSAEDIFARARQRADAINFTALDSQAADLEVAAQQAGLSLRGQAAAGAPDAAAQVWQKGADQILAGAKTQEQRDAIQRSLTLRWESVNEAVQRHAAAESVAADSDATQAHLTAEQNATLAQAIDPVSHLVNVQRVQLGIARQRAVLTDWAGRNGLSADRVQTLVDNAVTATHMGVLQQLEATGQDQAARAYLDQYRGEISGGQMDNAENLVRSGSLMAESQTKADAIMRTARTRAEAMEQVRAIPPGQLRAAVQTQVEHNLEMNAQTAAEQVEKDFGDAVSALRLSGGNMAAVPPAVWGRLPGEKQSSLFDIAKKLSKGNVETDPVTYYKLRLEASSTDPATRQEFLHEHLNEYAGNIAWDDLKPLMDIQGAIRQGDGSYEQKLGGFRTVDQVVTNTLQEAGMMPAGSLDAAGEAQAALFRRRVDEQVAAIQQKTGKPLTASEVQPIADELMIQVKTTGGAQRRVFQLQPKDKAIIDVNSIPLADRQRIIKQLNANHVSATDKAIVDAYTEEVLNPTIRNMVSPVGQVTP